jgi:hypothetical protein
MADILAHGPRGPRPTIRGAARRRAADGKQYSIDPG